MLLGGQKVPLRPQIISTQKWLSLTLPGAFRSSSVEKHNTGIRGTNGSGASFSTESLEDSVHNCFFESNMGYH